MYKSKIFCYKTDLILFNTSQKPIFLVFKNISDFKKKKQKPKDFVLFNKHGSNFSMPKSFFFFLSQHISEFLTKKRMHS